MVWGKFCAQIHHTNDTTDIYIKVPFGPKMYFVYYRYIESEKVKLLSDPR
jgi:hypothetical protein